MSHNFQNYPKEIKMMLVSVVLFFHVSHFFLVLSQQMYFSDETHTLQKATQMQYGFQGDLLASSLEDHPSY